MSVADDVVKNITKDIELLGEGEYGDVIIDEHFFNVPPLEEYLEPEPDVVENIDAVLKRRPHTLLGMYIPMHSPAQVVLFSENLHDFFWGLVRKIVSHVSIVTKTDLVAAARLVTLKTYYHELFHFDCDIQRQMYGGCYDALLEEALAVAWARRKIIEDRQKWQSQIGRMNGVVYNLFMQEAFKYKSPGYRDWVLYSDESSFKEGLLGYIKPGNYIALRSNGVPVEDLLYCSLGAIKIGYHEKSL